MDKIMNWLLEEEEPHIKYRTMIELQGRDKDDYEVKQALDDLLASNELRLVMDKFQMKSKWEHVNALLSLVEFGLTRNEVNIDEYVEQLIKNLNKGMKCARILLLRNLVALGYYEHPWVKEQIQESFATIRKDGTARCLDQSKKRNDSRLPEMGCYRQTTTYLLLAAELKKIGVSFPQFDWIVDFYRNHNVLYHNEGDEELIIKEMATTFFPIDHVNIGLETILYGLSVMGIGDTQSCEKAWKIVHSYEDAEGRYYLSDSFPEPYFNVGKVGESNKLVTLYVKLAQKYARGSV